jgi:hypothetical protein
MESDRDKEMKAKVERFAKPNAIGCAVAFGVVLAVIAAWFLGFFTWLLS